MKIGLGTVQFGMSYGLSNKDGQTPQDEVAAILALAAAHGIQILDTAALYGTSEEVLGHALAPSHEFKIVTKTPQFRKKTINEADACLLVETFHASLQKLHQDAVYGLLIHHADDLLAPGGELLFEAMEHLRDRGLVRKIGVSIYKGEQIDGVLERFQVDLVQLPVNVLDQRLLQGGYLAKLKERGIEVHARSVFLQGLLLMDPDCLAPYFESVKTHLRKYHRYLLEQGLSPLQGALGFVLGHDEIDIAVCGTNNCQQLEELIAFAHPSPRFDQLAVFAIDDSAILDPSKWPQ